MGELGGLEAGSAEEQAAVDEHDRGEIATLPDERGLPAEVEHEVGVLGDGGVVDLGDGKWVSPCECVVAVKRGELLIGETDFRAVQDCIDTHEERG